MDTGHVDDPPQRHRPPGRMAVAGASAGRSGRRRAESRSALLRGRHTRADARVDGRLRGRRGADSGAARATGTDSRDARLVHVRARTIRFTSPRSHAGLTNADARRDRDSAAIRVDWRGARVGGGWRRRSSARCNTGVGGRHRALAEHRARGTDCAWLCAVHRLRGRRSQDNNLDGGGDRDPRRARTAEKRRAVQEHGEVCRCLYGCRLRPRTARVAASEHADWRRAVPRAPLPGRAGRTLLLHVHRAG